MGPEKNKDCKMQAKYPLATLLRYSILQNTCQLRIFYDVHSYVADLSVAFLILELQFSLLTGSPFFCNFQYCFDSP